MEAATPSISIKRPADSSGFWPRYSYASPHHNGAPRLKQFPWAGPTSTGLRPEALTLKLQLTVSKAGLSNASVLAYLSTWVKLGKEECWEKKAKAALSRLPHVLAA